MIANRSRLGLGIALLLSIALLLGIAVTANANEAARPSQTAAPLQDTPAQASEASSSRLILRWPATAQLQSALAAHPRVQAAQARQRGVLAAADALRAGANETQLRSAQALRQSDPTGRGRIDWQVGVERVWRLPEKREADQRLADHESRHSPLLTAMARREAAREWLALWFGWQRADLEREHAQAQVRVAQRLTDAVARRLAAGDASQLELRLAQAEQQRVQAGLLLARARLQAAQATLEALFPELHPSDAIEGENLAAWDPADKEALRARYLSHSPLSLLSRVQTQRATLAADRARVEQRADPAIGAWAALDRGGAEKALGISLSIPIVGAAREATWRQARASQQESALLESEVQRRLIAEFDTVWSEAQARTEAARGLRAAAAALGEAAQRQGRAWSLGEGTLSDWLQAQRLAADAAQQALSAELEALEAKARLLMELGDLPALPD